MSVIQRSCHPVLSQIDTALLSVGVDWILIMTTPRYYNFATTSTAPITIPAPEIPSSQRIRPGALVKAVMASVGQTIGAIATQLFTEPSYEPQITQRRQPNGDLYWEVYEPWSGRTIYCMNEAEMMDWLDSREYR